jgi:hypothetical protein
MSGIINQNFSEEKCHSPSPLLLSPQFLFSSNSSINNNNVTGAAVAQVHVV